LIEGRRYTEHYAGHTPTNKHKSVRKRKVSVAVVVMVVMIGSREAKEYLEARNTDCSRLGSRKWFLFQALTAIHVSHRRHVPAANILIEGNHRPEHCAIVMVVKEDVEAKKRGMKRGRKE
jgi:hypothetical protein